MMLTARRLLPLRYAPCPRHYDAYDAIRDAAVRPSPCHDMLPSLSLMPLFSMLFSSRSRERAACRHAYERARLQRVQAREKTPRCRLDGCRLSDMRPSAAVLLLFSTIFFFMPANFC